VRADTATFCTRTSITTLNAQFFRHVWIRTGCLSVTGSGSRWPWNSTQRAFLRCSHCCNDDTLNERPPSEYTLYRLSHGWGWPTSRDVQSRPLVDTVGYAHLLAADKREQRKRKKNVLQLLLATWLVRSSMFQQAKQLLLAKLTRTQPIQTNPSI